MTVEKTNNNLINNDKIKIRVALGSSGLDAALCGGLLGGSVHEVFAAGHADLAAATGFTLGLAARVASERPMLLVRQDGINAEAGYLNGVGLTEFGLDPARIILVRAKDVVGVLRAGEQGARCSSLAAVILQALGNPRFLDLKASRRLSLAAAKSGVPVFITRGAAVPAPSAAETRWIIQTALSRPLAAHAPGTPAFIAKLVRHRAGRAEREWHVEWNRDASCFEERERSSEFIAPLSRPMVPISVYRPLAPQRGEGRLRA